MNNDEKFDQRWEFRRKEDDGDTSSDDSQPNASGAHDLVLLENDEAGDRQTVEANEKKKISSKKSKGKNNAVRKKLNGGPIKKNKLNKNVKDEDSAMFKDLKAFADSLIQELTGDRDSMFAHLKDEMRKLVALGSKKPIKKNPRCSHKNKAKPENCTVKNTQGNVGSNAQKLPKVSTEPMEQNERVLQVTKNDGLTKGGNGLTPPPIIPKPQFQNPRTHLPLGDHALIPQGAQVNKLNTDYKKFYRQFSEFRPEEQFGGFSGISHGSVGLFGQGGSRASGVAFPAPLAHLVTNNGSNISSLTYHENSLADKVYNVGPRLSGINVNFPKGNQMLSRQFFPYGIFNSNVPSKGGAEYLSVRPQDIKDGKFCLASLSNQQ